MEELERYLQANPDVTFKLRWLPDLHAFQAVLVHGAYEVCVTASEAASRSCTMTYPKTGASLAIWSVLQRAPSGLFPLR